MSAFDHARWLDELQSIAALAGQRVMTLYGHGPCEVRHKDNATPVTQADEEAEALILQALRRLDPDTPIVSEEADARGECPAARGRHWLVDPLDGTREYVQRNGEFTVNIGLVEHGAPVMGVVYAPAVDRMFVGAAGSGAFEVRDGRRQPIRCSESSSQGLRLLVSRSHGNADRLARWCDGRPVTSARPMGSSLKLGLLAAGEADLHPRFGPTMEWDTAAGHAVLRAAGGEVCGHDGSPLVYGKADRHNPEFIAGSKTALAGLAKPILRA